MFSASLVYTLTCLIIWNVYLDVFALGVDECDLGLHNCSENSNCSDPDLNANGTVNCTCKTGYTGNGTFCKDIDECTTDPMICSGEGFQCENTIGSYGCHCRRDYLTMPNETCVHKNDCTKMKICHDNAECQTLGNNTFNCSCKSGYTGDGKKNCTDINECLGTNDCHENATCENVPGSYECTCTVKVETGESCQASSYCPTQVSSDRPTQVSSYHSTQVSSDRPTQVSSYHSTQVSSDRPTQDSQNQDCKSDDDDDDDGTVIALVSVTIVLLVLCLIALIIAIFCIYKMRNSR